jgi:carboxymethylenebutenolidase
MIQTWQVDVVTADGTMPTFVAHPGDAKSRPLVILYMDALGIREELRAMARRMAGAGYYVMLPNLFYRAGGISFDPSLLPDIDPEMERLNVETTMPMVAADTASLIAHAERDTLADARRVGVIGYCMGGRHAITAAATFPRQIAAAASVHGGRLVTDDQNSAHLRLPQVEADTYFAFADQDPAAPAEHLHRIREEMGKHDVRGSAELHNGAIHGFAFPERYCYHADVAERVWTHWFAMLERNTGEGKLGDAPT